VYVLGVTPWTTDLLGKLMVSELYEKFPTLYATRMFTADFHKRLASNCILSQINPLRRNFVSNFIVCFHVIFQLYLGLPYDVFL
jgi:hypothetical protein